MAFLTWFAKTASSKGAVATGLAACLFLIVWGAKIAVVGYAGSDVPSWDQWNAEGDQAFLPYLRGELKVKDFFEPHNEHRIACSRALALALFALNGQWDTRLQCVANAAIHALLAVVAFLFGRSILGRGWSVSWFVALALLLGLPIAWHNTIGGVHSQQYFLLLFSVLGIAGMTGGRPTGPLWWTGVCFTLLSLFSMASGLLTPVSIACVTVLAIRSRHDLRRHWPTFAACILIATAGWLLVVSNPGHETLKAGSIGEFALTLRHNLQWPVIDSPWYALVGWLPWLFMAWRVIARPHDSKPHERALFGIGAWVLLQFAATAYARGAGGPLPANRYLDTVIVGVLANILCLLVFLREAKIRSIRFVAIGAGTAVGLTYLIAGLNAHLEETFETSLPHLARILPKREVNTRAYLMTGDRSHIENRDIPHASPDALAGALSHPEFPGIMPASSRSPLPLEGIGEPPGSFAHPRQTPPFEVPEYERAWSSHTDGNEPNTGTWISAEPPDSRFSHWKLDFAGTPHDTGLTAGFVDPDGTLRRSIPLPPDLEPGRWKSVHVLAPAPGELLRVSDSSPVGWIAFRAPAEMATWSYHAMRLARNGLEIAIYSSAVAALLFAAGFLRDRFDHKSSRRA